MDIFTNVYLHGERNADKIDAASRVIFPVVFLVFVTTYWAYYLVSVGEQPDEPWMKGRCSDVIDTMAFHVYVSKGN